MSSWDTFLIPEPTTKEKIAINNLFVRKSQLQKEEKDRVENELKNRKRLRRRSIVASTEDRIYRDQLRERVHLLMSLELVEKGRLLFKEGLSQPSIALVEKGRLLSISLLSSNDNNEMEDDENNETGDQKSISFMNTLRRNRPGQHVPFYSKRFEQSIRYSSAFLPSMLTLSGYLLIAMVGTNKKKALVDGVTPMGGRASVHNAARFFRFLVLLCPEFIEFLQRRFPTVFALKRSSESIDLFLTDVYKASCRFCEIYLEVDLDYFKPVCQFKTGDTMSKQFLLENRYNASYRGMHNVLQHRYEDEFKVWKLNQLNARNQGINIFFLFFFSIKIIIFFTEALFFLLLFLLLNFTKCLLYVCTISCIHAGFFG